MAVLGFAAPSAHAALTSIGLQEAGVNGGAITTVATDAGAGTVTFNGSYGTFTSISISAVGEPITTSNELSTTAVATSSAVPGVLIVFITEQGLGSDYALNDLTSNFSTVFMSSGTKTVLEETLVSLSNALFVGTFVGSTNFIASPGGGSVTDYSQPLSGDFSVTEIYTITASKAGTANDNIDFQTVPEPLSMLTLGTGLIGLGALRRNRG